MKSKLRNHKPFMNKILTIPLSLILSVYLFMPHALAGDCEGGPGCFKCGQMDHRHPAIPATGIMPAGCQPGTPGDTCGITAGRLLDNQDFPASVTRVENHPDTVSPAAAAFRFPADLFTQKPISPDQPLVVTKAPPIYLSNLALLC